MRKTLSQYKKLPFSERLYENPLYDSILRSKTFIRLKDISFLGAIDFMGGLKKKFSRFEHSIAVGELALLYAKLCPLSKTDQDHLVLACLLHDIGHGPFSHSMESVFHRKFGLSHHISTHQIIQGRAPFKSEIPEILSTYHIDIERILSLIDGTGNDEASFALNNPINLDTIDGIIRTYSCYSTSKDYDTEKAVRLEPADVVEALIKKDQKILDEFWHLKNFVYGHFIHKTEHLYADAVMAKFADQNNVAEIDFFLSEKKFRKKYSQISSGFVEISRNYPLENKQKYRKKIYRVKRNKPLVNARSFFQKYQSEKK